MSTDLYIDYFTDGDLELSSGQLRLTLTEEELIRQKIEIVLQTFAGEWFVDLTFGVPYFQNIFGKSTKDSVDAILRSKIRNVDGVQAIEAFESELDATTRKYSLEFTVLTNSGNIINSTLTV